MPQWRGHAGTQSEIVLTSQHFCRQHRAKTPGFPIGIQERTFELVCENLDKQNCRHCPVCLACDDTKLLPSLRPFWSVELNNYCILGSTGEVFILPDPDQLASMVRQGEIEKATKVRFISLTLNQCTLMKTLVLGPIIYGSAGGSWCPTHCRRSSGYQ